MVDRLVAVGDDFKFPAPVRTAFMGDVNTAVAAGVTSAMAAEPDFVAAVGSVVTDALVKPLITTSSTTRTAIEARYFSKAATPEMFAASATKDGSGNVTDWAPAINAILAAGYREIEFGADYYTIRQPITVPINSGVRFIGRAGMKAAVLDCYLPAGNDNRGVIECVGTSSSFNFAGITIDSMWIKGNGSICHGIYLKDLSYPAISRTIVEGFRGAGILLDYVQDGFLDIVIQGCGRSTGNYSSLPDRQNNSKTTYSGLHFKGTDGHCNMLRITGQIENNTVSPYVWVNDPGAIGLQFNDIHAECREPTSDQNQLDFMVSDGADIEISGMNMSTMRNGLIMSGYGGVSIKGGRGFGHIHHVQPNVSGSISIIGAAVGDVAWSAVGGQFLIADSSVGSLVIDYPSQGPTRISNSRLGAVSVDHAGGGDSSVRFSDCVIDTFNATQATVGVDLINSRVIGACSFQSVNGRMAGTKVGGALNINVSDSSVAPYRKETSGDNAPTTGTWAVRDICWRNNTFAGDYIGYVCVVAGTPGTWRPFGQISA